MIPSLDPRQHCIFAIAHPSNSKPTTVSLLWFEIFLKQFGIFGPSGPGNPVLYNVHVPGFGASTAVHSTLACISAAKFVNFSGHLEFEAA